MVTCPACDGIKFDPHTPTSVFFRGRIVNLDNTCMCCSGAGAITREQNARWELTGIEISKLTEEL